MNKGMCWHPPFATNLLDAAGPALREQPLRRRPHRQPQQCPRPTHRLRGSGRVRSSALSLLVHDLPPSTSLPLKACMLFCTARASASGLLFVICFHPHRSLRLYLLDACHQRHPNLQLRIRVARLYLNCTRHSLWVRLHTCLVQNDNQSRRLLRLDNTRYSGNLQARGRTRCSRPKRWVREPWARRAAATRRRVCASNSATSSSTCWFGRCTPADGMLDLILKSLMLQVHVELPAASGCSGVPFPAACRPTTFVHGCRQAACKMQRGGDPSAWRS